MSKIFRRGALPLLAVSLNLIILSFLLRELYPVNFQTQKPLIFELIEFDVKFPLWIFFLFNSVNILIFWSISRALFPKAKVIIPVLLFSLSPWSAYLTIARSFYIILTTFVLTTILGILEMKSKESLKGATLWIIGSLFALYSSIFILLMFPLFILGLIKFKLLIFKVLKNPLLVILFLCLPLFFFSFKNITGVKNIYRNQVGILSDPGLMTAINNFQGESKKIGLNLLTRIVESKYIYFGEYFIHKVIKNISPPTYFTPQERLLNFSFTPPILVGFLIPFLYGLYFVVSSCLRNNLILSTLLIIPALLSRSMVDLNRLVLFKPVIILIISFGLIKIASKKRWLYIVIILILLQLLVTTYDIDQREFKRFERYQGIEFEIGKQ